ncbi:predicted coiled-coil protein [Moesziomyces antarcticus T-34]|uniref:Predicted coiled-coil protein n=1 Tax=Pseudozyma antarctica (strain T-34) TaxID=1151754 RepID=M9LVE0_PSEA3|nr:predicted coiled-coil protein [Moesziomyces antarcticus T-34]
MVLYFTSTAVEPPATIYVGKDKFENEELLRYGLERDVWFHVDKLSSAHVYLRLPPNIESWETIPEALVNDCSQLVKANSIEGNKKANITIIYTPWSNIKKTGDMAVGAVTFFNDRKVKRFHIKEKDNSIVNRLNKTKKEVQVDHEAERQERLRDEGRVKKAKAIEDKKAQQAEQKRRKEEAEARDYSKLYSAEAMEEERRRKEERRLAKLDGNASGSGDDDQDDGMDSDDSFM